MLVLSRGGKASDIDSCGLSLSELEELWLGPNPTGSCFRTREELVAAWEAGRAVVMRLWGSDGRRPQAWWEFEADGLKHPGYYREKSTLWRTPGVLTEEERIQVETEWRADFDAALAMDASERREHLELRDVPVELVKRWVKAAERAERRRQTRAIRNSTAAVQETAPGVSSAES
jgi:hypothetical protein